MFRIKVVTHVNNTKSQLQIYYSENGYHVYIYIADYGLITDCKSCNSKIEFVSNSV